MKKSKLLAVVLVLVLALGVASTSFAAAGATITGGGTTLIEGYTTGPTLTCAPSGFADPSATYTYEWYSLASNTTDPTAYTGTVLGTAAAYTVPAGITAGTSYYGCKVTDGTETAYACTTVTVSAPTYTLAVSPASQDFGSLAAPYAQPAAKSFTVTNSGNTEETGVTAVLSGTDASSFTISAAPATSIAAGGTTTFSVQPVAGLTDAKTYTATVTVTGAHNTTGVTCTVTFTVAAPTYTLAVSPASQDFGSLAAPYTQPAAKSFTVTNSGNTQETGVTAELSGTDASSFTISAAPAASIAAGGTTTFSVQPKAGLTTAKTYTATVTVKGTHNTTGVTCQVTFTVAAPTYTFDLKDSSGSALSSINFGTAGKGYTPVSETVTVTNTGNSAITLSAPTATGYTTSSKFTISGLSRSTIPVGGKATFKVTPKASLATGTYTETITLAQSTDAANNKTFTVTFTVDTAKTYTIKANPATITFPALAKNYSSVGLPAAITITNTGNTACNVISVVSSAGSSTAFTVNPLGTGLSTALASNGTMSIVAQPKTGLASGTYTETITVVTDMNTRVSFTLSVTVGSGTAAGTVNTIYNSGKYIWASGAFKAGSTLTTTRLYSGSARYDGLYKLRDGKDVLCCYDISASPSQTVTGRVDVSFSLGTEYSGKKMTVLHTLSNGRVEFLYGTVASNGVLTVTTSYGLSPFMVVNATLTAITISSPDTGDAATFAFIGVLLMLGGCVLFVIKKRRA